MPSAPREQFPLGKPGDLMRAAKSKAEDKPLRIAGYVRVSSQRQATEGDSLVAQQHEIEQEVEFRKRRENLQVESLEFYVDAGRSAKDQNRPQPRGSSETSRPVGSTWSSASSSIGSRGASRTSWTCGRCSPSTT